MSSRRMRCCSPDSARRFCSWEVLPSVGLAQTLIFSIGAALIFAIAFAAIPARLLLAIPFINQIQHTDSTFATVLIVPTSIVAGFGFHLIDQRIAKAGIGRIWGWTGLAYAFLCFLFLLGFAQGGGLNPVRFSIYAAVVLTAAVVAPWLILNLIRCRLTFPGVAVCVLATLVVLGRGASYPPVRPSGSFFEPAERISLTVRPAIVERLAPILAAEPARVTGVDYLLGPGYNAAIGLEGISGPDAVMLRSYRELTMALKLPYLWFWGIAFDAKSLAANGRALDFLDVKYVISPEKLERAGARGQRAPRSAPLQARHRLAARFLH